MTQGEPFFSLYSRTMRDHLCAVSDAALRVFLTLGTYIDERGWCYPGVRELSARTGYRVEDVQHYLDELAAVNWIRFVRRNERDPLTGNKLANIYELHPDLVAVRTPIDAQLEADDARSKTERERGSSLIQEQPETRITLDPELAGNPDQNQHQNQNQQSRVSEPDSTNHHQQTSLALRRDDPRDADPDETTESPPSGTPALRPLAPGPNSGSRPARTKPESTAPHGAKPLAPQPPAPVESLAEYANPLPDGEAEALVDLVVATVGNMTTPNARRLVVKFGMKQVRAGLNVLGAQDEIVNPGGFLRSMLERYAVDAERDAAMRKPESATERQYRRFDDAPEERRPARDPQDFIQR